MKSIFSYLFTGLPGQNFKFYLPLIILSILLVLGGIMFSVIYKKKKKEDFAFKRLFSKTGKRMILFGGLFLFLTGVRYENIPYFSMRIWFYLSLVALLYFTYKTLKVYKKDYPREKSNVHNNLAIHKKKSSEKSYLPNKKQH